MHRRSVTSTTTARTKAARKDEVLAGLPSDERLTAAEAKVLACLVLKAQDGLVKGLTVADLGQHCGMLAPKVSGALRNLALKGYVRARQERMYEPNTYELLFLSDVEFERAATFSPAENSGGSPSPPYREGLGAPPPDSHVELGDIESTTTGQNDAVSGTTFDPILWPLAKLRNVPPAVWTMLHNPPSDLSQVDLYLGYRLLTSKSTRRPWKCNSGEEPWLELEEFVRNGGLDERGVAERLLAVVKGKRAIVKHEDGSEEWLLENEVALIRRRFGIEEAGAV